MEKARAYNLSPAGTAGWLRMYWRLWASVIVGLQLTASQLSADVLAYWHFNESSPGVTASSNSNAILDSSGNGRHLTAAGSPLPAYSAGNTNYGPTAAMNFSAGNDRAQTSQTAPFNFGLADSFTLEAVVKTAPGATFTGNIVGRDWGQNLPSWWFRLEAGFPRVLLSQTGGPEPNTTSSVGVNDGNWHHVAAVRDAVSNKIRVYVDYQLTAESSAALNTPPTNAQNLVVGAYNAGTRQYEGDIDFVRISSGALTPDQFVMPQLNLLNVQPANGTTFYTATNGVRFKVTSATGVASGAIRLTLNNSNRSPELIITGNATNRDVAFYGLLPNTEYTALISATNQTGQSVSRQLSFDTYDGHVVPVFVRGENGYHTYRIPSLLTTRAGTLLAFSEARKNSASDAGDIDLVVKRSFDQGKTWSAMQIIWDDAANTIGNPCPVVDQSTGVIWMPFCRNNDRVFITKSADDGLTWSTPIEITSTVKLPSWGWYATGPGVGIQLEKGAHKGRMVIPCDFNDGISKSHAIYSDDHGQTWLLGGIITPQMNECQVVELVDGRLMMNMRNSDSTKDYRALSISTNGGMNWTTPTHDPVLVEPICQASFLRYSLASKADKNRLLFSNPASASSRVALTVRVSYDEGATWPVSKLLHGAAAAYSILTVLPDNSIGCLYEAGVSSPYETITFARFNLEWLTGGADKLQRRELTVSSNATGILVSWPLSFTNAVLESTAVLSPPTWLPVNVLPTAGADKWQVHLPATNNAKYFRLSSTNAVPN